MLKNTKDTYGVVAKGFHWIIALIILGLILVGLYMADLPYSPQKLQLIMFHKSFGLLVLWLAGLRIIWRAINVSPVAHPNHTRSERILAFFAHVFLYGAMVGMPLSGWIMSSAAEYPVPFFGFNMPDLVGKNMDLAKSMRGVHQILGYMLIAGIGLHALGALKHHFIDHDSTLKRMMARPMHKIGPYVIIVILGLFTGGLVRIATMAVPKEGQAETSAVTSDVQGDTAVASQPYHWQIAQEDSTLSFRASVYGKEFTGVFKNFNGQIVFDPAHPEDAVIDINVNTQDIESGDEDRDTQMGSDEWFNVAAYPSAHFKSNSIKKAEDGTYLAIGDLTIKDHTVPVRLPFALILSEDEQNQTRHAAVTASLTLNRLDFGLGTGRWATEEAIGHTVTVELKLAADSAL